MCANSIGRLFIDGSWGIDALNRTPRVHGHPHDIELAPARDAKAQGKPHRILAANLAIGHEEARPIGDGTPYAF